MPFTRDATWKDTFKRWFAEYRATPPRRAVHGTLVLLFIILMVAVWLLDGCPG